MATVLPSEETRLGAKLRNRLAREPVVWLTTVNARGVPQPNPVWFVWEDGRVVTYNLPDSHRVRNVGPRPQVSLHFNQRDGDGDIVVLTGTARVDRSLPAPDAHPAYAEKYASHFPLIGHDAASFASVYSAPIAVDVDRARGM